MKKYQIYTDASLEHGDWWGKYAIPFDTIMSQAKGGISKREVAKLLGLPMGGETLQKILYRRKCEGKIRRYRGSRHLIEWIEAMK